MISVETINNKIQMLPISAQKEVIDFIDAPQANLGHFFWLGKCPSN